MYHWCPGHTLSLSSHQVLAQEHRAEPGFLVMSGKFLQGWGPSRWPGLFRDPSGCFVSGPTTWHRDLREGLRLPQRVNLGVSEGLAHGTLQVPASQEHRLVQGCVLG